VLDVRVATSGARGCRGHDALATVTPVPPVKPPPKRGFAGFRRADPVVWGFSLLAEDPQLNVAGAPRGCPKRHETANPSSLLVVRSNRPAV
jgi:hypothetical protein